MLSVRLKIAFFSSILVVSPGLQAEISTSHAIFSPFLQSIAPPAMGPMNKKEG